MLQRLPQTALKFRSPTLRALVRDTRRRSSSALLHHRPIAHNAQPQRRQFSNSSPFASGTKRTVVKKKKGRSFVPLKAPVTMTETTRNFFKALLKTKPDCPGIILNYNQSSTGEPRMVFSFDFVKDPLGPDDEAVSLEVDEDGTPKSPSDSVNDGLQKLYVHHNAFMKVLGGKVDVDVETLKLTMYDREGNKMDPNA